MLIPSTEFVRDFIGVVGNLSIRRVSGQLQIPRKNAQKNFHSRLKGHAHKIQRLQALERTIGHVRKNLLWPCSDGLTEKTLHVLLMVKRHSCRIWGP
jgi:hypothetical protein